MTDQNKGELIGELYGIIDSLNYEDCESSRALGACDTILSHLSLLIDSSSSPSGFSVSRYDLTVLTTL